MKGKKSVQFTLRSAIIIGALLSLLFAWWADHRQLYRELAKARHDVQVLSTERGIAEQERDRLLRRLDALQFSPIEKNEALRREHDAIIRELHPLGVRLFFDRTSGFVSKAEVPDTTNISAACNLLKNFPQLAVVKFTAGPILHNQPQDWSQEGYASAYAEAVNRPYVRTVLLDEKHRSWVFSQFREHLPNVVLRESPGAF